MKNYKKIVASLLTMTMAVAASGCGNAAETKQSTETKQSVVQESSQKTESSQSAVQESSEEAPQEITRISLYSYSASLDSGVREGYMKELFAKHGLEVEVWAYSADKTNAILASGDLPDIMYVNADQLKTMIEGDMVLELTDYLDQIPHLTEITNMDGALNYMREFQSAGTGDLYALPTGVGKAVGDGTTERQALKIYWDYYDAIGCPEFSSMEELIPILKQIQEKFPTDKEGNKVYALANYYDPQSFTWLYGYGVPLGWQKNYHTYLMQTNFADGTIEYLYEDDGVMYEALRWYNTLYREGLYDPNSITMERNTISAKLNSGCGAYILPLCDAPGWAPYYLQVYFDDTNIYRKLSNEYGSGNYIVVNKDTKNLDACLRLLDVFSDADAYLEWRSMPEGEKWYVEDGNTAYLTDKYLDSIRNGETFKMSTGEEVYLWNTMPIVALGEDTSYVDGEGNPRHCHAEAWDEALEVTQASPQFESWKAHYGYDTWAELLEDKNKWTKLSYFDNAESFIEPLSEDQKLIVNASIDIINEAAWKMIYAENDADFEKIWEQAMKDVEELGAREVYEWSVEALNKAIEIRDSLQN